MYNIIPLIIILVSLSIIIVIIVRKFSALAVLDVDTIQTEKEAMIKERIISNKIKREIIRWTSRSVKIAKFIGVKVATFSVFAYEKLLALKDNYTIETSKQEIGKEESIVNWFDEVDAFMKNEEFELAEKKLIEIISLDSKNHKAFIMLGDAYFRMKNYQESKQSYEHALNLLKNTEENSLKSEIYFDLSLVNKAEDDIESALICIKEALQIEASSPRYLDTFLDLSIINKDKIMALEAYDRLKAVNPENQKLNELKEQIDKI